ncbi:TonB-dependent receptor [Pseudoalteromonas sp. Isolate6]|uniref:TonB-dependent receptor domain-containing protein n=1 Tax=Pseudoalteromonas sp. Isolate6 TaxID=2908527 RepID=UPI001EFEAD22|nr:TonB-dependent receptor [Pseudoalteromonas sp. Isolate6]MCG9759010.1 TonB-dependent receptor [Pseudoalteromonas sp. Isolate6]
MRLSKLTLFIALATSATWVQAAASSNEDVSQSTVVKTDLDAVTVTATRTAKTALQSAQAVNVISSEQIERKLDSSVFETLDTIPNVSVSGGPRAAGHKFNIRGFSDAEDVMVTIDGMLQTFEKYRMGSLFTDPELYRSISIKRGTSTVLHGGGALGGVVQFELKDAADFLQDGEVAGGKIKLGYDSNNTQKNASVIAFARPNDSLDLLAGVVKRDSDDWELSNDETLDNSAIENSSVLLKGEYFLGDDAIVGASYTETTDNQRTEFNTTDPGAWGTVYREVEQSVTNLSYELNPANNPYLNLSAKAGYTSSQVTESDGVGMLEDYIGIESNYEYNITTLDVMNTSVLDSHTLTYGVQYTDKERIGEKTALPCIKLNYETYACEQYGTTKVTAEMTSQPGGTQKRSGVYIQDEFTWQQLTVIAGLRYERYSTSPTAKFQQTFAALDSKVTHSDWAGALSVNYQLTPQWAVFANRQEGFRAPLIDELYDQYGGRQPGLALDVEYSNNTEVGVTYQANNILTDNDTLTARFIYFDISVDDEITSVTSNVTNPVPAPRYANRASNDRDGIELEVNFATPRFYSNFSYSDIDGKDQDNEPLWYLPADKMALDLGASLFDKAVQVGAQIVRRGDRDVQVMDRATRQYSTQTQKSYILTDLYASWDINAAFNLRVAVDNVFNKEYKLMAGTGGGIGDYGFGRNIKTQISWRF